MSNTTAISIADEVVTSLNGFSYGIAFTAARKLWPFYELKDLSSLKVTVVPKSVEMTMMTRTAMEFNYQIDIAVQKSVTSPDASEVSTLMDLAVSIANSFRSKVYSALGAVCFKQTIDPLYSIDHIAPPSVFTSVIVLTFKVVG